MSYINRVWKQVVCSSAAKRLKPSPGTVPTPGSLTTQAREPMPAASSGTLAMRAIRKARCPGRGPDAVTCRGRVSRQPAPSSSRSAKSPNPTAFAPVSGTPITPNQRIAWSGMLSSSKPASDRVPRQVALAGRGSMGAEWQHPSPSRSTRGCSPHGTVRSSPIHSRWIARGRASPTGRCAPS